MTHCCYRWLKLWKEMRKECCFQCSHHKIWEPVVCRAVLLSYSWIIQKIQWEPLLIQYYLNIDQSQNAKYAEAGDVYTSFKFCTSVVLRLNVNTGKRKTKQEKKRQRYPYWVYIMPSEILALYLMVQKWKCLYVTEIAPSGCAGWDSCYRGWKEGSEEAEAAWPRSVLPAEEEVGMVPGLS